MSAARLAVATLFFLVASVKAQEKTWPALLGASQFNTENRTSPRFGITYNTRGHESVKAKRVEKSVRYIENHGAGHLSGGFLDFVRRIQQPDAIGLWADATFEAQRDKAIACGGPQAEQARKVNPRSLSILVEDRPFRVFYRGQWIWAGGFTEGRQIRVAVAALNNLDGPGQAWLSTLDQYLRSEMGRVFGFSSDLDAPCARGH